MKKITDPKRKNKVREYIAKRKAEELNFPPLTKCHIETLKDKYIEVQQVIDAEKRFNGLKELFTSNDPLHNLVVCDTAITNGRTNIGKHMYMLAAYGEGKGWISMYKRRNNGQRQVDSSGDTLMEGELEAGSDDNDDDKYEWVVRMWNKGGWTEKFDPSNPSCTFDEPVDGAAARGMLSDFIGDRVFVDYNAVDIKRITTWGPPDDNPFLDVKAIDFCVLCKNKLFGPTRRTIRSINATLMCLTNDLYNIGGDAWTPPSSPLAHQYLCQPHLTEVTAVVKKSDEVSYHSLFIFIFILPHCCFNFGNIRASVLFFFFFSWILFFSFVNGSSNNNR